jgi:hypothetical protein
MIIALLAIRLLTWQAASTSTVILSWAAATDDVTAQSSLVYEVRQSRVNNLDTVANAEANGLIALAYGSGRTTATISGLTPGATYYFNVIVKDEAGNKSAYEMARVVMPSVSDLTVKITSPLTGATVRSTVKITLTAADETGVTRLDLLINGFLMAWYPGGGLSRTGDELTGTYTYSWQTFPYNGRVARIDARAADADGHIAVATANVSVTK